MGAHTSSRPTGDRDSSLCSEILALCILLQNLCQVWFLMRIAMHAGFAGSFGAKVAHELLSNYLAKKILREVQDLPLAA